jgi:hypothetical protein
VSTDEARRVALSLPEAVEQNHHVTAAREYPEVCAAVWWGKRLAAVRVTLTAF